MIVHSGALPDELISRYRVEGADLAAVDREALEEIGVRLRETDLLSDDFGAGVRHDPEKLAEAVCGVALVRL